MSSITEGEFWWRHYAIYYHGNQILSLMSPLMSPEWKPKFKCGLLLLIPTWSVQCRDWSCNLYTTPFLNYPLQLTFLICSFPPKKEKNNEFSWCCVTLNSETAVLRYLMPLLKYDVSDSLTGARLWSICLHITTFLVVVYVMFEATLAKYVEPDSLQRNPGISPLACRVDQRYFRTLNNHGYRIHHGYRIQEFIRNPSMLKE
jgi:hypothetical protein